MVPQTGDLFDREFCQGFGVFPQKTGESMYTATCAGITDISILDYVRYKVGGDITVQQVSDAALRQLIDQHYTDSSESRGPGPAHSESNESADIRDSEVVKQIDATLTAAICDQASDIHFEPSEQHLTCRARIDGYLQVRNRFQRDKAAAMLSRIKIMAGLDIAEKRRPQDGRIRYPYNGRTIDIRVSVIPTDFGEKAVLRILDKASLRLDLSRMGFTPEQLTVFKDRIGQPHGIILVTGPTGSGKTTTLYAALNHLRSPDVNISTVEDPIEYNLEGINQTQVKPGIGVSFSSMLRALLRQDPNIIMVGEIRDAETLEIAVRASLTGHLVLSTLHTNDAIATVARLLDMGAEPLLLASTVRLIVAQRLVRRVCPNCADSNLPEEYAVAARKLGIELGEGARIGSGCEKCHQTGYSGRIALYEQLSIDGSIKQAIANGEGEERIRQRVAAIGFRSMLDQGRHLVGSGVTTPLEVLREVST